MSGTIVSIDRIFGRKLQVEVHQYGGTRAPYMPLLRILPGR